VFFDSFLAEGGVLNVLILTEQHWNYSTWKTKESGTD